jgi:hypothetical protein
MWSMPKAAEPLVAAFSIAFTRPTFQRVTVLILGAILALRHRTVTGILRAVGSLARGHWSDFHRVLCWRVWSNWPLGRVLATFVLELIPPGQPVICPVDDTTPQHKGKQVYGKGRHHDACRSTHSHIVWVWGHKWVVLAINVKFPFAARPWALPVLCALYRPEELNKKEGRRHKTPIHLAQQLIATLIHWFPERRFILVGDGGYASHALAAFCYHHRRHVSLVSRFHPQANLYAVPSGKRSAQGGRPRLKGRKLPAPCVVVQNAPRRRFTVRWYGGQTRRVELVWGEGHWYKGGEGLVPIRWVFVHGCAGHAPGRILLHHRPPPRARPDREPLHRPLEYRGDVSGSAPASGLRHAPELVEKERAAHGTVPAGIVQPGEPDFRTPVAASPGATAARSVVCQERIDLQRRDRGRAAFVLE